MIEVKNITKKYGNFLAVDNISFEVKDNEIVGFLGPNGAGKSTTMNMITGYIEPTKGKIFVNGYEISKEPNKVKKQIGYMPEGTPLYQELTVREFINYMASLKRVKRKERKEKVDKVLEQTGLTEVAKKQIRKLSRGYKQRVSLAGALIGDPEVLILDEPTVGLDPKQITEIRELIKKLGKKHTVILSSHILSEVSQICEKVIIINKGKILAVDTPEHLEEQFKEENSIYVTVEDKKNKIATVCKKINNFKESKLIKTNSDGSKQYLLTSEKNVDLRKEVFDLFPKNNINILELKKTEVKLEDAFLKLINSKEKEMKAKEEKEKNKENKQKESKEKNKENKPKKEENKQKSATEKHKAQKDKNIKNKTENNKTKNKKANNKKGGKK